MVDRAGTTFVFRLREDTGASPADIARAYAVARDVFDMRALWARRRGARRRASPPTTQIEMLLDGAPARSSAPTRWLLRTRPRPLDIARRDRALRRRRARPSPSALPGVLVDAEREALARRASAELAERGRARGARRAASRRQGALFAALDIVEVAGATERAIEEVAALHFLLGGRLHLHWLRDRIARCRATTAGRRWRAPRCATTSSACTPSSPPTCCARGRDVGDAEARLDAWIEANRPLVERCHGILGDIRAGGTYDLTTLPVALRELRNLIQGSAAGVGGPA